MAEARHVTFGGAFKFDDSGLIKANRQVDELIKKTKSIGNAFDGIKGFKGFSSSINEAEKSLNGFESKFDKLHDKAVKGIKTKIEFDDDQASKKLDHFKDISDKIPTNKHTRMSVDDNASTKFQKAADASKRIPKEHNTTLKAKNETQSAFNSFDKSIDKSKKHVSVFKSVLLGTFAGNIISNGFNAIVGGLKSATAAGMAYNKQQDTMKTVWTALTNEAPKDGKKLTDYINTVSQHSIYAAGTVDKMAQSFYHVHSNVKETQSWTKSFVALGSTLHMTDASLQNAGVSFAKIVAGGKANSQDMATMINQFPMFGEALQKSTGKSMKQLYAMSAAGKLSATQFTEALDYLGKKYKGGTAEAMTSFQGMSMYIKSRWSVLTGGIMQSSFKLSKGVAHDMQDLMKDDMMKKYAHGVSSVVGGAITGISALVGAIDRNKKSIIAAIGTVGHVIGDTFGVAKSAVKMFGVAFLANVDGPVNKSSLADRLGQFQKGFHNFAKAVTPATDAIGGLAGALGAGIFNNVGSLFRGLAAGLGASSKNGKSLKETFDGIAKAIYPVTNYFAVLGKHMEPVTRGIGELAGAIGKQVWQDFATIISTTSKVIGTVTDGVGKIFGVKDNGALETLGDLLDKIAKNKAAVSTVSWALTGLLTTKMVTGGMTLLGTYSSKLVDIAAHFKLIKKNADEASASEVIANNGGSSSSVGGTTRAGSTHYTGSAAKAGGLTSVADTVATLGGVVGAEKGAKHMAPGMLSKLGPKIASSKLATLFGKVSNSGVGKVARVTGKTVGKIPLLSALMAGTSLIGMNKKNAGGKIGDAAGSLAGSEAGASAGALVGSVVPGIGTAAGALVGGAAGGIGGSAIGHNVGKFVQNKAMPTIGKTIGKIPNPFKGFKMPNIASMFTKAIGKVPGAIGGAWKKVTSTISGWGKSIGKFFAPVNKAFGGFVKGVGRLLKPVGRALQLALVVPIALVVGLTIKAWQKLEAPIKKVGSFVGNIAKGLGKTVGNAWKSMSKNVGRFGSGIARSVSGAWTKVKRSTSSAWKVVSKYVINPVKNIGKAVTKYIVKGVVNVTSKAWNGLKRSTRSVWNTIKRYVVNPVNSLYKTVHNKFNSLVSGIKKIISPFAKWMSKTWGNIKSTTVDFAHDMWKGVVAKFNKMASGISDIGDRIKKSWHSLWNGISGFFGNIWDDIHKKAKRGFGKVVDVLNTGIGGIDKVISAFGGSSKAIATIKYATGTGALSGARRPITKPTFAMLNDGNDSPETGNREVAVLPNGQAFSPQERNWTGLLPAGTEVLNARESAAVFGPQRFAKGTGLLGSIGKVAGNIGSSIANVVGSLGKGLKGMISAVGTFVKNPAKSISKFIAGSYTGKAGGQVVRSIGTGALKAVKKTATSWWSTLWNMADGAINGGGSGGSSEFLSKAIQYSKGHPYVWGAAGPNSFDCSGLVMYTLKKMGISYPHFSGAQYSRSKPVAEKNARPGDLVFFGSGGSQHVGIYSGPNRFWSAQSPSAHPNIGYGPIHGFGESFAGIRRVPGLHDSTPKKAKKSTGLQGLIQKEVGGGFLKWITKHLAPLMDSAGGSVGNPKGQSVERWKPYVVKALKANGFSASASQVSAWMKVIGRESNGNPRAVNNWDSNAKAGIPSKGLVQTIEPTFNAYKFKNHGNILNGYDDLLAGIHYAKAKYGSGASMFSRVSGPEGYANGGYPDVGVPSIVGEHGFEIIKPKQPVKVIPHGKSKALLSNLKRSVDLHPTINLNITATDADDIEKKAGSVAKSVIEKMFGDLTNGISDPII